jgi:hypothetical protein
VLGPAGDADARGHLQGEVLELERRLEDLVDPVDGGLHVLVAPAARQQDGELVAAEAGDGAQRVHGAHQPQADLAQQLVAQEVAERVVDLLEAVEVEDQQRAADGPGGRERGSTRLRKFSRLGSWVRLSCRRGGGR